MVDIKGYEGLYAITSCGKVWSYRKQKFLAPNINKKNGYMSVILSVNKKQKRFYIHRLVAEAFIPNQDNLPQINHKDENKKNNCVNNLEWTNAKENINYGSRSLKQGMTRGSIVVCLNNNQEYYSTHEAARQLNLSQSNVQRCCAGIYKQTHGYSFKYKEVM